MPGFDVAHIKSFGSGGSEADVLENVICMCRRHHQLHEGGVIPDVQLRLILYHFYGYGPEPGMLAVLDGIKDVADGYGAKARFDLSEDGQTVLCYVMGLWRTREIPLSLTMLESMNADTILKMVDAQIFAAEKNL